MTARAPQQASVPWTDNTRTGLGEQQQDADEGARADGSACQAQLMHSSAGLRPPALSLSHQQVVVEEAGRGRRPAPRTRIPDCVRCGWCWLRLAGPSS
eukprot:3783566-Rhodomonas_salina.3